MYKQKITQMFVIGMHDNIDSSSVSAKKSFKIELASGRNEHFCQHGSRKEAALHATQTVDQVGFLFRQCVHFNKHCVSASTYVHYRRDFMFSAVKRDKVFIS